VTTVRGHEFERDTRRVGRMRDASEYRCSRCGKLVRVYSRSLGPLEEKLAGAIRHDRSDCSGVRPEPPAPLPTVPFEGPTEPLSMPRGGIFYVGGRPPPEGT
jgi:hypothetical protein